MKEIAFSEIAELNLKDSIIILDIDGTITDTGNNVIEKKIQNAIFSLKGNNTVYLCSNSKKNDRTLQMAKMLNVDGLETPYRKPSKKIMRFLHNNEEKPLIVIGDKVLTDGIFSKRIKAKFIKVKRIRGNQELLSEKIYFVVDDLVNQLLNKIYEF